MITPSAIWLLSADSFLPEANYIQIFFSPLLSLCKALERIEEKPNVIQ